MDGLPDGLDFAFAHPAEGVVESDGTTRINYHIHGTSEEAVAVAKSALRQAANESGRVEISGRESKSFGLSGLKFGTEVCPYVPSGSAWNSKKRVDNALSN